MRGLKIEKISKAVRGLLLMSPSCSPTNSSLKPLISSTRKTCWEEVGLEVSTRASFRILLPKPLLSRRFPQLLNKVHSIYFHCNQSIIFYLHLLSHTLSLYLSRCESQHVSFSSKLRAWPHSLHCTIGHSTSYDEKRVCFPFCI